MNWKAIGGSLALVPLIPGVLCAGQLYGSIILRGAGVSGAAIEVHCGGAVTPGTTAAGGAYRINVPQQGQCKLTLPRVPGSPSAIVFSNPNPSAYSFELIDVGGRFELRRR